MKTTAGPAHGFCGNAEQYMSFLKFCKHFIHTTAVFMASGCERGPTITQDRTQTNRIGMQESRLGVIMGKPFIPTVCPSHNSASLLSYQSLPTSSELQRGHGQEAKRG